MITIHRYEINSANGINAVSMPANANVISCGIADDIISVWAEIDTTETHINRYFCVFGTNADMGEFKENYESKFIGTVQKSNRYAFHIYEVKYNV